MEKKINKYYTTVPLAIPFNDEERKQNYPNEFFGNGWSVKEKTSKKFILTYISGSLQGSLISIEISESDFIAAKEGRMTLDDLCIKYDTL